MPSFLYYLPGLSPSQITLPLLVEKGMAFAFEQPEEILASAVLANGPDGGSGSVVVDKRRFPAERLGYYPATQTWELLESGTAWFGYENAALPGPEDLVRDRVIPGRAVRLLDGADWKVPTTRQWVDVDGRMYPDSTLPSRWRRERGGKWFPGEVLAAYRRLQEIGQVMFDEWLAGVKARAAEGGTTAEPTAPDASASVTLTVDGLYEMCCEALGFNYRINAQQVNALGLLGDGEPGRIVRSIIDLDGLDALQKKRAAPAT